MTEQAPQRRLAPADIKSRMERYTRIAQEIIGGLDGDRFEWRAVDHQHARPILEAMQITLVTKTRLTKLGYRLVRGARPVGTIYFTAPLSRRADVYVLECQCEKLDDSATPERPEAQAAAGGEVNHA